jgi:hypothetical protein
MMRWNQAFEPIKLFENLSVILLINYLNRLPLWMALTIKLFNHEKS